MNLRTPSDWDNRYCGPAAVAYILGCGTGEAARRMREATGRRSITGADFWEIRAALNAAGYAAHPRTIYFGDKPTLAGWLRDSRHDRVAGRVFLVATTRHWQVVTGRRYACNRTRGIVSIRDERVMRRARVEAVYEVRQEGSGL